MKDTGISWTTHTWNPVIKPWWSALVEPDGYSITMTKHFERAGIHYWGAVAKR